MAGFYGDSLCILSGEFGQAPVPPSSCRRHLWYTLKIRATFQCNQRLGGVFITQWGGSFGNRLLKCSIDYRRNGYMAPYVHMWP